MGLADKLPWRLQSYLGYRPVGEYRSLKEYLQLTGEHSALQVVMAAGYTFPQQPVCNTETIHGNFREVVAQHYGPTTLYTLQGVSSYRIDHTIGFIDKRNKLINVEGYSAEKTVHPFFSVQRIPKAKYVNGKTLFLAVHGGDTFYWHWLFDLLPKVGVLDLLRKNIHDFDHIVINPLSEAFQQDILDILKIDKKKLIYLNENDHYSFESLTLPVMSRYHPFIIPYLNSKFSNPADTSNANKRIYVSREGARWRRILNEGEMLDMLEKKYNFEKVRYEDLSFSDQIKLCNNTNTIISSVGSNQSNMVFCPPGSKIIEIQRPDLNNVSNWVIANLCKHKYYLFEGEHLPYYNQENIPAPEYHDIQVDVNKLDKFLEKILR